MSKRKACKSCKMFVDAKECPACHTSQFAVNWKGRLTILSVKNSEIAKKIGLTSEGEYAIKVT